MENHRTFVVICDEKRVKKLDVTCHRCKQTWRVEIPGEAFDADLRLLISCDRCHEMYVLHGKKFRKLTTEEVEDGKRQTGPAKGWSYDA